MSTEPMSAEGQAVTSEIELGLLAELSDLLTAEHGPVPEKFLAEAMAAWRSSFAQVDLVEISPLRSPGGCQADRVA
jgi:hypothetical protein